MRKKIFKRIKGIVKNIQYIFESIFFEKDKSIVVLDSWFGERFADNPRFLFQYLSKNKDMLNLSHVVWVTNNLEVNKVLNMNGYESYMMNSIESVKFHKVAYYHVCNNAPFEVDGSHGELLSRYSYRAKRINLWHGTGVLKCFGMASNQYQEKVKKQPILYGIKKYIYSNSKSYRKIFEGEGGWGDCYYLTTSVSELEKFQKCYPLPRNRFIVSGYPRVTNEVELLSHEKKIINLLDNYSGVILYLPTFRSIDSKFDFSELELSMRKILHEKNFLWIQKKHLASKSGIFGTTLDGNSLNLDSAFDINVLISKVTFVVTDYSSVIADALYHKKAVLFYVPDYKEYLSIDRGLSADANQIMNVGKSFYNTQSFVSYMRSAIDNPEMSKSSNYLAIRSRIWGKELSIEKVWADIIQQTAE